MVIRVTFAIYIVLNLVSGALASDVKIQEWKFDKDQTGSVPAGFLPGKLNSEAGRWEVVQDGKAGSSPNVLARLGGESSKAPQIIFIDGLEAESLDLTVRIKAPPVGENQAGGVVFRASDEQNYYVVWFNPQDQVLRLDKVVNGEVTHLQDLTVDSVEAGKWHLLRVLIHGPVLEALFNNRQFLSGRDQKWEFGSYKRGKIGLWAQGKGPVYFDTVRYANIDDTTASHGPFGQGDGQSGGRSGGPGNDRKP
jgi:hypothetical protein